MQDPDEENEQLIHEDNIPVDDFDRKYQQMQSKFNGYSDESINAGIFLGQNYPYVPGDD